jgi:hypothetical protein
VELKSEEEHTSIKFFMSALRKSQRIFSGVGYFGNFLNTGLQVGDIYQMDDRQFIPLANIADLDPAIVLDSSKLSVGTRSNLSYTRESYVEIKFKGDASAPHLAKGEVELNFKRKNSAFVSLKDTETTAIRMELIRQALVRVWNERGYKNNGRHVLVFETVRAASGTIIYSEEKNNKVILKAKADEAVTSVVKLGSGEFEYVTNAKATLELISTVSYTPMFKALYIKRNGNFEILG